MSKLIICEKCYVNGSKVVRIDGKKDGDQMSSTTLKRDMQGLSQAAASHDGAHDERYFQMEKLEAWGLKKTDAL